jgi:hypothetical protein
MAFLPKIPSWELKLQGVQSWKERFSVMLYDEQTQLSSRRVAGNGALPSKQDLLPMDAVEVFIRPLKERASREIK